MRQQDRTEWVRLNTCRICIGSHLHTCTGYDCRYAVKQAEEYFDRIIKRESERMKMFRVRVILKNATQIEVICKNLIINTNNITGKMTSYKFEGIEGMKPMYIDVGEIVAVTSERAYQYEDDDEEDEE